VGLECWEPGSNHFFPVIAGLGFVEMDKHYKLAAGVQVREEDFGLLFYQMKGPRLHFVASGRLLAEDFFRGEMTLAAWMGRKHGCNGDIDGKLEMVATALRQLKSKGVILEC